MKVKISSLEEEYFVNKLGICFYIKQNNFKQETQENVSFCINLSEEKIRAYRPKAAT